MKRNIKKVVVSVVIVIVAMLLLVASIIGIRKLRQSMFQPEKVVEENTPVEEVVPTEETTSSDEVTDTEEESVSEDATATDEKVEEEEPVDPNVTYANPFKEGQEMHASEDNVYVPERRELPERLQKIVDEDEPMSEEEYAEFYRHKMEYESQLSESDIE